MTRATLIVAAVLAACGAPSANPDAAGSDAPTSVDASMVDSAADAAVHPLAGFGALSGDCVVLDDELTSPNAALFTSAIDFARAYDPGDFGALTPGGQEIILDDNAGGSSLYSEVFAYELLARCEDATLLKTETEIVYDTAGVITDLLVDIDSVKLGVSVTRAVAFPFEDPYTVQQASDLLTSKLSDIALSTANVSAADRWVKQILAVVAYSPQHADSITTALAGLSPPLTGDTIVWVLVTNGDDMFLY